MDQPSKFRKIPVEIEAIQFTGTNWRKISPFVGQMEFNGEKIWKFQPVGDGENGVIAEVWDELHDTWVGVKAGQWIIKGVKGEFYPCDDEVFQKTYEEL